MLWYWQWQSLLGTGSLATGTGSRSSTTAAPVAVQLHRHRSRPAAATATGASPVALTGASPVSEIHVNDMKFKMRDYIKEWELKPSDFAGDDHDHSRLFYKMRTWKRTSSSRPWTKSRAAIPRETWQTGSVPTRIARKA